MTPREGLAELIARLSANDGRVTMLGAVELASWPAALVAALQAAKLIEPAGPAIAVECPGCERQCSMPVHVMPAGDRKARAFVVCDKRDDVNRVEVPLAMLAQWQASGARVAAWLARMLGLATLATAPTESGRWEVGLYRGARHSAHLVLRADQALVLMLAGHTLSLADVLDCKGDGIVIDRRALHQAVDHPVASAGDAESAAQRRERLRSRVSEEKAKRTRAFLAVVAAEEGISVSRLKQLVADSG